jgi:hypothetical protein
MYSCGNLPIFLRLLLPAPSGDLVEIDRRFRGDRPDEGSTQSETSFSFYNTTRKNIPKDSSLHIRRCGNLKYHKIIFAVRISYVGEFTAQCVWEHKLHAE